MMKADTMTNLQVYTIASNLLEQFKGDINLPVRIGYYIQQNMDNFVAIAQELDKMRTAIFDKYGTKDEENSNQYHFDEDKIEPANKEIEELFNQEIDVNYYTLKLDQFRDIELSFSQLSSISWMLEGV